MLSPRPGEIDLWWVDLDEAKPAFLDVVSASERRRAAAMSTPRASARRLAASGFLRIVLARYEGRPAAELALRRDARGQLRLVASGVRFSVSHARSVGAIAVARGRALGIDVEPIAAAQQIAEVADAYLPGHRNLTIRSAAAEEQNRGWVELWTEVEARAKMTGDGIGNLSPTEASRLLALKTIVARFVPLPGFLATLAYDGPPAKVRIRRLTDGVER